MIKWYLRARWAKELSILDMKTYCKRQKRFITHTPSDATHQPFKEVSSKGKQFDCLELILQTQFFESAFQNPSYASNQQTNRKASVRGRFFLKSNSILKSNKEKSQERIILPTQNVALQNLQQIVMENWTISHSWIWFAKFLLSYHTNEDKSI